MEVHLTQFSKDPWPHDKIILSILWRKVLWGATDSLGASLANIEKEFHVKLGGIGRQNRQELGLQEACRRFYKSLWIPWHFLIQRAKAPTSL